MNTKSKSDWAIAQAKLKTKWAMLTDDDLPFAEGQHDELIDRIQDRTGESREAIEHAVQEACLS
jgi:uncharacterized protein YjbJ (UPF0337 family)